ncbi:hypothetical protein LOK49_LG05G01155 [Camellia lanceoleosa]|uniref:Uncharacterized protein n=1 Tax=Camellia lanceoleosa TaxID=1840588 RepID=A0ACC0HPR8_9ERIC|nr:hypothetical protein LOK49_LG05G01155 [Camellia lanceoleosa]
MALIQDSLGADFKFDWDAALEHIQSKVGLDDTKLPLSKGHEQPGTSNTTVHTSVDVEPSGQSPSQDIRAEIGAGWDYGNVIREGSHSGLGCSKNSEVDMSGTSLNKVRIGGHSDPILPDAIVEIELEAPSLDILPTSSQSCEETLQPSPPTSPTLQPSSPVLSDCDMEEQVPTTGKVSLSDTFMFCYAGGSKRIRASIPRCPKSSKLIFAIIWQQTHSEPRIEDSYSIPIS